MEVSAQSFNYSRSFEKSSCGICARPILPRMSRVSPSRACNIPGFPTKTRSLESSKWPSGMLERLLQGTERDNLHLSWFERLTFDVFGNRPLLDAQMSKACMNPIQ